MLNTFRTRPQKNLKMRSYPEREPENKNLFEVGTENKEKDSEV